MHTSHFPLSLEGAPYQDDSQKEKYINKDQDQTPFHLIQNFTFLYPVCYPPPTYDEDTISTTSIELTETYGKSDLSMLYKERCQDQSVPSCSTSPYPL